MASGITELKEHNRMVLVSVINWNNSQATNTCLRGLSEISGFNLVVIDNGSEEELVIDPEIIKSLGTRLEVVRNKENLGFSGGHNQAAAKAVSENYDYLLLLNNDTEIIDSGFVSKLTTALESNTDATLAAPTILSTKMPETVWYAGGNYSRVSASVNHLFQKGDGTHPTQFATGCCLMVSVSTLVELGGLFDDRYFVYWEDADLCARVLKAGKKILYVADAEVLHHVSSSLGVRSKAYAYYNIRNKFLFYRRNTPAYMRPLAFVSTAWLTIKYLVLSVLKGPRNSIPTILKAFVHGLFGKYGRVST